MSPKHFSYAFGLYFIISLLAVLAMEKMSKDKKEHYKMDYTAVLIKTLMYAVILLLITMIIHRIRFNERPITGKRMNFAMGCGCSKGW